MQLPVPVNYRSTCPSLIRLWTQTVSTHPGHQVLLLLPELMLAGLQRGGDVVRQRRYHRLLGEVLRQHLLLLLLYLLSNQARLVLLMLLELLLVRSNKPLLLRALLKESVWELLQ